MSKSVFGILVVFLSLSACASKQEASKANVGRERSKDVFSLSPREAVSLLATDEKTASDVFDGIKSGESKYLDLYEKIRPASDGSVSESLDQSIGLAIVRAPSNVIQILSNIRNSKVGQQGGTQYLNWPCRATSTDFDEPEKNSDKEKIANDTAVRELKAKIKALQSIKSANSKVADECRNIAQQALGHFESKP
jgi:hypothetical protein